MQCIYWIHSHECFNFTLYIGWKWTSNFSSRTDNFLSHIYGYLECHFVHCTTFWTSTRLLIRIRSNPPTVNSYFWAIRIKVDRVTSFRKSKRPGPFYVTSRSGKFTITNCANGNCGNRREIWSSGKRSPLSNCCMRWNSLERLQ